MASDISVSSTEMLVEMYPDSPPSSLDSSIIDISSPVTSPLTTPDISETDDPPHSILFDGQANDTSPSQSDFPNYILVIGGLGYIGSHTVLELLREGYNVIIVDNLSNSYESVLHKIKKLIRQHCLAKNASVPLLHFHRFDYRSRSMRFLLESYADLATPTPGKEDHRNLLYRSRITGVIHFAAYKSVADSIRKPLQYYKNNVSGLVSLLELLDQYNIRNFIFSSSATVYGSKASLGAPLREEDLIHHPENIINERGVTTSIQPVVSGLTCPYARTKYFSEAILADLAAADSRWHIVALRYFNPVGGDPSGLLGENPRTTPTNLYPVLAQVLTGERPALDIFGADWSTRDGTAIRDFIHVLDVARGHIDALRPCVEVAESGFRAYNLGSGTGTTVLEAVRSLETAANMSIPLQWVERRPGDVGICVASTDRAERELGWRPRESIAQCAADLWNFVQRNTGLDTKRSPVARNSFA